MGSYVTNKKDMKFQSQDALKVVQSVINDADMALNDKSRVMEDSPIGEAVAGAAGMGVGAGIGFAALYLGGSVSGLSAAGIASGLAAAGGLIGGGMAAGIAVLAAPAVILGAVGVGVASHVKSKKLKEAKELVYKNALAKQTHLFTDVRFITRVKKEFIENEIFKRIEKEISEIDALFENI